MARPLVIGEYARVNRIIVDVQSRQHGQVVIEFIDPNLYTPEMAAFQGRIGKVKRIFEDSRGVECAVITIDGAGDWDFRVIDLEWEGPHTYGLHTQDFVERGFYKTR
jgi:hypothetical protein